jgi:hypothetical protein
MAPQHQCVSESAFLLAVLVRQGEDQSRAPDGLALANLGLLALHSLHDPRLLLAPMLGLDVAGPV